MPVLLSPEQAPDLPSLLNAANTAGLEYTLPNPEAAAQLRVRGLGSLTSAQSAEVSFLSNPRLSDRLLSTQAGAVVLTPADWEQLQANTATPAFVPVLCQQPYVMYALLAQWFDQHRIQNLPAGIHPTAVVHPEAKIGAGVSIGPFSVIEAGAQIGDHTRIGPHCVVGAGTVLGQANLLHAGVTLYHNVVVGSRCIFHSGAVLGADGFGFAPAPDKSGAWVKIAQLGQVIIGDDVEIGANTTVDRGALEATRIGNGVKLDNQIMIGHNVQVGDHTAMAACVGVAGSTRIGQRCTIGGAAMLSGHLVLGDDVHISGGTAVTSNISAPGRYTGVFPHAEHRDWQRNAAVLSQLSTLRQRLRKLENK